VTPQSGLRRVPKHRKMVGRGTGKYFTPHICYRYLPVVRIQLFTTYRYQVPNDKECVEYYGTGTYRLPVPGIWHKLENWSDQIAAATR
jgi:hypothetical protein